MNNKLHIKSGDTVMVLSGKDKGKKGKVLSVNPDDPRCSLRAFRWRRGTQSRERPASRAVS